MKTGKPRKHQRCRKSKKQRSSSAPDEKNRRKVRQRPKPKGPEKCRIVWPAKLNEKIRLGSEDLKAKARPTMIRGAEAKAEKTDSGAVITITGKDSETAGKIQKAAAEAMKSNDETTEEEGTDKEEQTGNRPPFGGGAGGPPPDMRE